MWRIFNKLFGWHYINMLYAFDSEVFRVRKAPSGTIYVKAYGEIIPQNRWKCWEPLTFIKEGKQDGNYTK